MANTRKDNPCEVQRVEVEVEIPNKIRKRFGDGKKKTRSVSPWAILAMFNPAAYFNLMEQMKGKRRFR